MPEFVSNPERISGFLVPPNHGISSLPTGWTLETADTAALCNLARVAVSTTNSANNAGVLSLTKVDLPLSSYAIAILVSGAVGTPGKARVNGGEWIPLNLNSSTLTWISLGTHSDATTRITLEIDPTVSGKTLKLHGLLLEGDVVPQRPVASVLTKLQNQQPVTVAMMGDSVTENAKPFDGVAARGGSSTFEKGNPGILLELLRSFYDNPAEVTYIQHRDIDLSFGASPPPIGGTYPHSQWERNTTTWLGETVWEGRNPRVGAGATLVNVGKGGATSEGAWIRTFEQFTEPFVWRYIAGEWSDAFIGSETIKKVLRYGVAHYAPDLVFVNFGTNDANSVNVGRTTEQFRFRIKTLATRLLEQNCAVILATPHLWTDGTHQNPHTQPLFADVIRTYATCAGLTLADLYNEFPDGLLEGIHPRDAGHCAIAEGYRKALLGEPSVRLRSSRKISEGFVDNGDGTITDRTTGLMWLKDASLSRVKQTPADADAFVIPLEIAGYKDWRLPSLTELLGLVNLDRRNPALPEGHPFLNVSDREGFAFYHTSSLEGPRRWGVDLMTGTPAAPFPAPTTKVNGDLGYVFAVRSTGQTQTSASPASRLASNLL